MMSLPKISYSVAPSDPKILTPAGPRGSMSSPKHLDGRPPQFPPSGVPCTRVLSATICLNKFIHLLSL